MRCVPYNIPSNRAVNVHWNCSKTLNRVHLGSPNDGVSFDATLPNNFIFRSGAATIFGIKAARPAPGFKVR